MKIKHYEPMIVLNQMSNLIDDVLRNDRNGTNVTTSHWMPAVDIREEKDRFVLEADLPGISKDAVEISMANGVLTIKGERAEEKSEVGSNWSRIERVKGSFHRQFTLPSTADGDHIKAFYETGVLVIDVPKKEIAKPKRIVIEDSNNSTTS